MSRQRREGLGLGLHRAAPGCTGREKDEGAEGGAICCAGAMSPGPRLGSVGRGSVLGTGYRLHTRRFCLSVVCSPNERECQREHWCVFLCTKMSPQENLSHIY